MRQRISDDNPFGYDRYGYAWEHVPRGAAHLDFGCDDGGFLDALQAKQPARRVGLEVRREAVDLARRQFPDLDIRHLPAGAPLPLGDATFDSVTLLDVLEHVADQAALLSELGRVLRPGGVLIITVPGLHLFSGLDRGNIQLLFPGLFRWYYLRTHSRAEYDYHYVNHPDGMVGCLARGQRWHEHFSRTRLRRLVTAAGLTVCQVDGTGLFHRFIDTVDFLLRRPRWAAASFARLKQADCRYFHQADLFLVAAKPPA